jgi:ABC-type glycerol-3-phosphate transport system substrate-binding protein
MNRERIFSQLLTFITLTLMISIISSNVIAAGELSNRYKNANSNINEVLDSDNQLKYENVLNNYKKNKTPVYNGESIIKKATEYSSANGKGAEKYSEADEEFVLISSSNISISWLLNAPIEGLYEIQFKYSQVSGSQDDIEKSVKINNLSQFAESDRLIFNKYYSYSGKPIINSIGDEVQPIVVEKPIWKIASLSDSQGISPSPYLFLLKKGENKVTLEAIQGEIKISSLSLKAPTEIRDYQEIKNEYNKKEYKNANSTIRFEGESYDHIVNFNSSSIQLTTTGDPSASPASYKKRLMNMIGNSSFKEGGNNITWRFNVDKSGLYKLGVRFLHIDGEGLTSGRAIKIDDEIPFRELEDYRFDYARLLSYIAVGDSSEDYLFYLEEGEHTLTMEAQTGVFNTPVKNLEKTSEILQNVLKDIVLVTGTDPDTNYDYELDKKVPDLLSNIDKIITLASDAVIIIDKYSTSISATSNNIKALIESFKRMRKNPDIIQRKYSEITNYSLSISDWMIKLKEQPLGIDYISFLPANFKVTDYKSSFISNLIGGFYNFFISFVKDYNAIGVENEKEHEVIDVWITRGKEWGEIAKEIADSSFTPKEKIGIRLNVLPSGSINGSINPLLLAINSGQNLPDVVLSLPNNLPVEYAIRGVVLPLDDMPNINNIKQRFTKGLNIPLGYQGKTYGLPETSNFRVMFYRTDILKELGIAVPQTWDEVYNNVLPVLYQNNKQMYIPEILQGVGIFDAFLYQNGGAFYKDNNTKTALDSNEAYIACQELTDLYVKYGIPYKADFYNRFRTGEMPIGIANFNTYISLISAAPEISAKWDIALIPGKRMKNGEINRTTGGISGEADIILKSTTKKDSSYKFLDWWTSAETQKNFSKLLEGRLGKIAKWNTANIEAFSSLNIKKEHITIIKETWNNSIEQPVVFGGYLTTRNMANALNKTVIQRLPVRSALEEAVEQINSELSRKQKELK